MHSHGEANYHNRYVMFEADSDSSGWVLDIINLKNGVVVIKVNGGRQPKPSKEYEELIKADMQMQTALANFIVKVNQKEE